MNPLLLASIGATAIVGAYLLARKPKPPITLPATPRNQLLGTGTGAGVPGDELLSLSFRRGLSALTPAFVHPSAPALQPHHSAQGDPTGRPGEGNIATASSAAQLDTSGGWGIRWTGPGKYEARKFNATSPGGGSDTVWVRVG